VRTSYVAALIGSGVGPSLTPALHEREGARQGLSYAYRTVDITVLGVEPAQVGDLVAAARAFGFDGLNITHPCKQLVIPHLDDLAPEARALGAVNTVVFRDGRAIGHNTDVTGFARSFARGLSTAATELVVQVGAGGAGAAVATALLNLGAGRLVVVDIDPGRAKLLATSLAGRFGPDRVQSASLDLLPELVAVADGLVNATPLGMVAHPGTSVLPALLRRNLWVADIVYRPLRTQLVRDAEAAGCRVLTGAGMAVFQAVDAFELITGRVPDTEAMFTDFAELVHRESDVEASI
jgi:shikimate dehydrogenase